MKNNPHCLELVQKKKKCVHLLIGDEPRLIFDGFIKKYDFPEHRMYRHFSYPLSLHFYISFIICSRFLYSPFMLSLRGRDKNDFIPFTFVCILIPWPFLILFSFSAKAFPSLFSFSDVFLFHFLKCLFLLFNPSPIPTCQNSPNSWFQTGHLCDAYEICFFKAATDMEALDHCWSVQSAWFLLNFLPFRHYSLNSFWFVSTLGFLSNLVSFFVGVLAFSTAIYLFKMLP